MSTNGRSSSQRDTVVSSGSVSGSSRSSRSGQSVSENGLQPSTVLTALQPAIETAVTRLLVSIKALLETLSGWGKQEKTGLDVSDVYVRLGNDFNAAVAAFASVRIDMT